MDTNTKITIENKHFKLEFTVTDIVEDAINGGKYLNITTIHPDHGSVFLVTTSQHEWRDK